MKEGGDVRKMREIAEKCFALVREYKGSHSGEHGDGIVRSEFHESMFGPRIVRAFEAVKDAFDPKALLNPGRVVRAPRMDDRALFRYAPDYAADPSVKPVLDWSAHPGPQGGFLGAVEMCNNNGTCRKFDANVMCPSYRVTRDEQHLTRGRANTLRLALTGQIEGGIASEQVQEAMSLCVSCKGCKRECPTGVDMARMKIEVLAARNAKHGVPLKDRLVAHLPTLARYARFAPWLANLRDSVPGLAKLSERFLGLAASRSLPRFRSDVFRDDEAKGGSGKEVLLFGDTFNRYFEPENLRAAVRVLAASGYSVKPARGEDARPLCCGRTYLAAGMVEEARAEARRTLTALAGSDAPVLGLEPSCLMTLRDEFTALLPGAASEALSKRAFLITEFLEAEGTLPALKPGAATAHIHGHCHQKAFGAFPAAVKALRRVPGMEVKPIASSCCGMAGAFGYEAKNLEASKAMAELSLLPAVRAAAPGDVIVADGTSCRHQIHDLSGREALHSIRVLDASL